MVLGALSRTLLLVALTGCGRSPESRPPELWLDEAAVNGTGLRLISRDNACVLLHSSGETKLLPKPPCYFLRREGRLQQFSYPAEGVEWVVIAAGTAADAAARRKWALPPDEMCGRESQAILRDAAGIHASGATHQGGIYCRERGVDEKEFLSFAKESARR